MNNEFPDAHFERKIDPGADYDKQIDRRHGVNDLAGGVWPARFPRQRIDLWRFLKLYYTPLDLW
jgi:hypothetical protein